MLRASGGGEHARHSRAAVHVGAREAPGAGVIFVRLSAAREPARCKQAARGGHAGDDAALSTERRYYAPIVTADESCAPFRCKAGHRLGHSIIV